MALNRILIYGDEQRRPGAPGGAFLTGSSLEKLNELRVMLITATD